MARVEYILPISELTGSIGSVTFQRNASGTIAKRISKKYNRPSVNILDNQNAFSRLLFTWRNLSQGNRDSWHDLVINEHANRWGKSSFLNSFQWFISNNCNLLSIGIFSPIFTAPVYLLPDSPPSYILSVSVDSILLTFSTDVILNNEYLIVYATPPLSSGNLQLRKFRIKLDDGTWLSDSILDITIPYQSAFNVDVASLFNNSQSQILSAVSIVNGITGFRSAFSQIITPITPTLDFWEFEINIAGGGDLTHAIEILGFSGALGSFDWDDGTVSPIIFTPDIQYLSHTYAGSGDYICKLSFTPNSLLGVTLSVSQCTFLLSTIPDSLVNLSLDGLGVNVTGTIDSIPCAGLINLRLNGLSSVTGSINSVPLSLTTLFLADLSPTITGSLSNFTQNFTSLFIQSFSISLTFNSYAFDSILNDLVLICPNTLFTGYIGDLPSSLQYLNINGNLSATYGGIFNLPASLLQCSITTQSTSLIDGDINDWSGNPSNLQLHDLSMVEGDLVTFISNSSNLVNIDLVRCNLLTADFSLLSSQLLSLTISGNDNNWAYLSASQAFAVCSTLSLINCNLDETAVDLILYDYNGYTISYANINLSGNASPSAAGLLIKSALIAKGFTVVTS